MSPACTPLSTSHWLPTAWANCTVRCTAIFCPSLSCTTSTEARPVASRVTACCGISKAPLAMPVGSTAWANMPGSNWPSGLGTTARKVTVPMLGLTISPENCSLPTWG